ncbi:MAG: type II toxin-antitoxin system VapC family toxin [Clostridiales Family XIII bacterium]|jgi:PIN domain nuclease of toxin-antitoxin system|nr:type II toxin-antitoxin system VapC family toxin [Clostridiales Family XIII bacterium]
MDLLLDTNLLIFSAQGSLPEDAEPLVADEENRLFYSVASFWELSIKYGSGKLALPMEPWLLMEGLKENGYRELPITGDHVYTLGSLADIHRDPFDRIMVAQAVSENLIFLTTDETAAKYGQNVRLLKKPAQ